MTNDLYTYRLRSQCETWLRNNLPGLFNVHYARLKRIFATPDQETPVAEDDCLISHVKLAVGPWQSVCFHFKEPGEIIFPLEKHTLAHLRNQGHRVLTVRCPEDFKLWIQTYLPFELPGDQTASPYLAQSA